MNLKRLRTHAPVALKGRVPGDLHEALAAYVDYYRSVHDEAIDLWSLVVHVLRTFLDSDRGFHAWLRRAGEAAAEPGSRSGRGSRNA